MKKISAARWLSFLLLPVSVTALPQGEQVIQGDAEFHLDGSSYSITAADKTIISYDSFNVAKQEHVRFIQPSKDATLLNRVVGSDPSQIFGNISSNGKVFLVNPHGVYFGKDAVVDTGSLVVSTLDILDQDFLEDRFSFRAKEGFLPSFIHNEGTLIASDGGIGLIAPQVKNEGIIRASLNKVLLAGAEAVTLTFSGDGLMSFEIEDGVTEGLIEHLGNIEANEVFIHLAKAKETIQNVINVDGLVDGNTIIQENGKVRIAHQSKILAKNAFIEGSKVSVEGEIDVSGETIGGTLHILGDRLELLGADIDASGDLGGGTVLIGGNYQGKGPLRNAQFTSMDGTSIIKADAHTSGNGGRVILWADDTTLFDGTIYARGGKESGSGGFVETSGKQDLFVGLALVDTSAPMGNFGDWLLDPNSITIATAGAGTIANASSPNCATGGAVTISVATMQAASSNVALCAQSTAGSSITVSNSFTMASGVSLSMTAGSGGAANINLNASITTQGQPISLTGKVVLSTAAVTLDTTNAGANSAGANITLSNTTSGAQDFTLTAGTGGAVTMTGAVGATALTSLTVTGNTITQSSTVKTTGAISYTVSGTSPSISIAGNMTTSGNSITFSGPVALSGTLQLDTTNANANPAGAAINFSGSTTTVDGGSALTLKAGTAGAITFGGAVGGGTLLTSINATGNIITQSSTVQTTGAITYSGSGTSPTTSIGGSITTNGGAILMTSSAITISNTPTFDTTHSAAAGANITFQGGSATINGATTLTLLGGTGGAISLQGDIGAGTPLTSLSATGNTITQTGTVHTTGAVSYTGSAASAAISVSNNLATEGGIITITGPFVASTSPVIDSTNAGGTPAGANIIFSGSTSTIDGGTVVTVNAGTSGGITFGGIVGGTTPVTGLSATGSTITQSLAVTTGSSGVSYIGASSVQGNITTAGGAISFTGAVTLANTPSFDTTNAGGTTAGAAISFSSTITGTSAGSQSLTLNSGTAGAITFTGAIGATRLGAILISSAAGTSSVSIGNNITANSFTITNAVPTTLAGSSSINTSANNGAISFGGTINGTSAGAQALTLNAGSSGAITLTGVVGGTTRLGAVLISSAAGSTVSIGANITANSFTITNAVAATLAGSSSINTSANNGAISFGGTINATTAGSQALTLNAGSNGAITFTGAVGGTTRLGAILISSAAGTSTVSIGSNITANSFTITNAVPTALTATSTITTSANNGAISFGGSIDGNNSLTLASGSGTVTLAAPVGGGTALSNLSFSGTTGTISIGGNITAGNTTLTFPGAVVLTHIANINVSANNGNITFSSTVNGAFDLLLTAGTGTVTFSGAVGGTTALTNVVFASANLVQLGANITVAGTAIGPLQFPPTTLTGSSIITSSNTNGNVTFSSTLDATTAGAQNLTITASSGAITFSGVVGGTTRLGNLTISSTAGSSSVSISNNITANSFTITNAVPTTLTGSSSIDTSANNGAISFGGTINATTAGTQALTLNAGSSGAITLTGVVGGTTRLGAILISSTAGTSSVSIGANITANSFTITNVVPTILAGSSSINTSANNGAIFFGGLINATTAGAQSLTLNAGSAGAITLTGIVGGVRLGDILISSAAGTSTVSIGANIIANSLTITNAVPTTLAGSSSINTSAGSGGAIFFGGTLDATSAGSQTLTLNAGTNGIITFTGAVGATTRLGTIQVSSASGGSGSVNIGANITANSFTITNSVPSVLAASISIDTSANNGAIFFGGTIDATSAGSQGLTLNAGTNGLITFGGAVGSTTRPGAILISSASGGSGSVSIRTTAITANSFTITNAVPTVLSLVTSVSIDTSANNGAIFFGGTIDEVLTGIRDLTLNAGSSGAITLTGAVGGTTRLGNLLISSAAGTSTVSIGSNITANSFTITNAVPTTLAGSSIINTSANNGAISFGGTIDATSAGSQSLTLNAGTNGTITFTAAVGATTRLGAVLVSSASAGTGSVNIGANITANSFTITNSVPSVLATSIVVNTSTTGGTISFGGTIDGASAGSQNLTLNAGSSGAITLSGAAGATTRLGAVLISSTAGTSSVSIGNNITANSFTITNAVPTTLTGSSIINTSATNGAISFGGSIDGTVAGSQALTLNAGSSGAITLSRVVGGTTRLGAFTISSAAGTSTLSIGGNITANSFTVTNAVPSVLTASSIINTSANNGVITFGGTVDATNAGVQTLTLNAGTNGVITFTGAVGATTRPSDILISSASAGTGSVSIGANITANSFTITNSVPSVLAASITINTSTTSGVISFGGTIDGTSAGSQALTLNAGTNGAITLTGAVGATTRLGSLLISSASAGTGSVSIGSNITANSFTITNVVPAILTGSSIINTSVNNGAISFGGTIDGTVAGAQNLTLNAGSSGAITLSGVIGGTTRLGSFTISSGAGTSSVSISGNITANSFTVTNAVPAVLTASSIIDTSANNGVISFGGTVDATSAGVQTLTLNAGTNGVITFTGAVGSTTRLGDILVSSASAGTGSVNIGANITANSFTITNSVPTVLAASIVVDTSTTSGAISFGGTINATTAGVQALTLNAGTNGTIIFTGAVGATTRLGSLLISSASAGTGSVNIGANITASSFTISNVVPTVLTGSSIINTSAASGAISFGSTIDGTVAGSQNLTLNAGTNGTITLTGAVGATTRLGSLLISSASAGTGSVNIGANITANSFTIANSVPAVLAATIVVDTSANNGAISFGGTIDGASAGSQNLTLNAGSSGAIAFTGAVGSGTRLGAILVSSTAGTSTVSIGNNITGNSFTITNAVPTTLTGSSIINTSANNGAISFGGSIDGTVAGSQNLTLNAGTNGTITFTGAIGATTRLGSLLISSASAGTGSVNVGANITASSFNITNSVPTVLAGSSSINTSANNGAISFGGTIDASTAGSQALTLNAGANGVITFSGAIGATTRLGSLLISSAGAGTGSVNISANITANSFTITNAVHTTLAASSSIDTSANNGAIFFGGGIYGTTAGSQNLTLNAGSSGAITFVGAVGATTRLGTVLISSAAGTSTVSIGSNITANSFTITNAVPTILTGSSTIDTSANNGAISFGGMIDGTTAGAQSLTLNAGSSGAITLTGVVGGTTRLGALLISSTAGSSSVSISGTITANSFTVTNAVPVTLAATIAINTSANNGAIFFGGTVDATAAGVQALTLTAGSSGAITFTGAVGGTTRLGAILVASIAGTSSVNIGNNITANSFTITNAVSTVLTGSSIINTSANNGAISFGGAIDATTAGTQALTLNAGTNGTITFNGAVGATTRLGSLLVSSASAGTGSVNIGANITASSFTVTNVVPTVLTGSSIINTSATSGAISFGGTINAASAGSQSLTLNAGSSGAITLTGAIGATTRLGAFTISSAAGSSTLSIGGNISANSFTVTNAVPTTLAASSTINTSASNGAISFGGTIDGTSAGSQALTLNAGTNGTITFAGAVGATTRLGSLLISSASAGTGSVNMSANITANSFTITNSVPTVLTTSIAIDTSTNNGLISFGGTLDGAQTLTLTAGTGNIVFTGIVGGTTPLTALSASAAAITQSGALTTTGDVHYTNTGLLTIGGTLTIGSLVQSGGGTVLLGADINSMTSIHAADPIDFNTTVSLTAAGIGGMLFDSPVIPTIDSAFDLTFTVTGGGVAAPQLGSPSKFINTLTITAQSIVIPPLLIYAHTYNPHTAGTISANIISPGAHLLFSTPTTVVSGHFIIDVTGGVSAGSITFADTLDGPGGLTFDVGAGNLIFNGAIGSITPFGDLIISSAHDVTIAAGFTGSSFTQTAGTGVTTISGTITTTTSTGVSLNAAIALASSVTINTVTGNGSITFGSSSTIDGAEILSLTAGSGTIFLGGPIGGTTPLVNLVFGSAGLIEIKSDITVSGAHPLIFSAPVRIAGISTITSNNADITFESTFDGSIDPTINAGIGTVTFSSPMGNIIPLSDLTVIAGIINQNSSVTSSGAVTYINSGLATISGMISTGSFTQSGGGSVLLEAGINASSFIQLTDPVSFNTSLSLTAGGSGGILFESPIIPTSTRIYNLTLSARNGSIIGPQLGSPTEYINRLVMRARYINVPLIYANSILEIIPTVFNPYFEYIPGIYTNYWKEKDTLSAPWYFDPGLITDEMVTPWKGSIWAL